MKPTGMPNDSPSWRALRSELEAKEEALIARPPHYNKGIETNDYIKSWDMSYAQGNVIKYVTRFPHKSENREMQLADLKKAKWYLEREILRLERDSIDWNCDRNQLRDFGDRHNF